MPRPRAWPPAPAGRCLESSRRRPRAVLPIFCGDTHACQVTAASFSDRKCTLTSDRLRRRCQSSPVSCTRDLLISGGARTLAFPSLTTAAPALYFQLDGGGAQSTESGCGATLSAERVPAKVRNHPKEALISSITTPTAALQTKLRRLQFRFRKRRKSPRLGTRRPARRVDGPELERIGSRTSRRASNWATVLETAVAQGSELVPRPRTSRSRRHARRSAPRLIGLSPCIEECTVSSKLVRIPLVREGQRGESQASAGDENVYENSDDAEIFVGSS